MKTPFDDDASLVHGPVDISDSLTPPPAYGTYAIRWPSLTLTAPRTIDSQRFILWSCMDRRVIRPLYDKALSRGYTAADILVISIGGGPVQDGAKRITLLRDIFVQLARTLPHVEKIWVVAHTKVCGGIKHFCGGRAIADALKPEIMVQASTKGIDPEMYATQLLLPGAYRLLPETWRSLSELAIAEPNESTQSVKLYSAWVPADESKALPDIIL